MWRHLLLTLVAPSLVVSDEERIHKVHNVVLFRDHKSFCNLTPIQQIITTAGYESVTIENNICVGACYSYAIPRTRPADPGEIIGPYCDSCQPNVTKCYHVNLTADGNNQLGPQTIQKQVEVILGCKCRTCDAEPKPDCRLTDETDDLPDHMYVTKDKNVYYNQDAPDILEFKPPETKGNVSSNLTEQRRESRRFELTARLTKLLRAVQNEPSRDVLRRADELGQLSRLVDETSDRNVLEFVNYVNANADDLELDVEKLRDVLVAYKKTLWYSDNKIDEDVGKVEGKKKHHVMEEERVGLEVGRLVKGPHGSLVVKNREAA